MEKCLLNGIPIYAYDIKLNNTLNYALEKEWRHQGHSGNLICEDCGEEIILNAGEIKTPYFSHKPNGTNKICILNSYYSKESKERKKFKFALYKYFKNKFSDAIINVRHKFDNNRMSDIYVKFKNGREIAIEFQRSDSNLEELKRKHQFYEDNNIKDYWFLLGEECIFDRKNTALNMNRIEKFFINETNSKTLMYFNVENEILYIFKRMIFEWNGVAEDECLFKFKCSLDDVVIDENGIYAPNLDESFKEEYSKFIQYHEERKQREIIEAEEKRKQEEKRFQEFLQMEKDKEESLNRRNSKLIMMASKKLKEQRFKPQNSEIEWYKVYVRGSIIENEDSKRYIHTLTENMKKGIEHVKVIKQFFEKEYNKESNREKKKKIRAIYYQIEEKAGFS